MEVAQDENFRKTLMVIVNCFESGLTNPKINTKVSIKQSFMMNNHQFQLSSNSGQYTSSVFHSAAYVCNDQLDYKIDQFGEKSDSVYMLFYRCDD